MRAMQTASARAVSLLAGTALTAVFLLGGRETVREGSGRAEFSYDSAALPTAKPWTSEAFQDDLRHT